jgi:enoyl-CoA hydratase/carnithine racemase
VRRAEALQHEVVRVGARVLGHRDAECDEAGREGAHRGEGNMIHSAMAEYATILVDDQRSVGRITLNRPDKRNPIDPVMFGELVQALRAMHARVIVLTGAGAVFSAGADLAGIQQPAAAPPASLVEVLTALHDLGKPVVAMVNGHALAGGLGLVVACDLVIAADTAQFGTTEIAVGLWPMMITAEIARNVGRKRMLEMMLTGRRLSAAEALACGLVTRVVPADELEVETMKLAAELSERSPATLALGLRAFYRAQDLAYEPALRYLEGELARVLALEDAREGIAAFLGKRRPVWKGR